jgi:hypothetical protein
MVGRVVAEGQIDNLVASIFTKPVRNQMRPYAVSVEEGERINNISIRCSSRDFIVGIIRVYVYPQCGGCQSPAFFKNKTAKLHAFKYDDPTIPVVASS